MYCRREMSSFGLVLGMVSSTSPSITDVLAWGSDRRVMKYFSSYRLLGSLTWAHSNGLKVWCVLPLLRSYRDEVGYSSSCYSMVASSPCARDASRSWLWAVWQPSWLLSYPYCGPTGMRWAIPAAATVWWHPALVPGTHLGPGCGQYGSHLGYCLTLTAVLQGWGGLFQQLLQYGGIQPLCQGRI